MSKTISKTGALALGASVLLTACHDNAPTPAVQDLPVARVSVVEVTTVNADRGESFPGTVVPRTKALIESKITGHILELNAEPGQSVKAGDILVRIEAPEISAQVDRAVAAMELARRNDARMRKLFDRQAATRAEIEAAESQLLQAKAAETEAESMQAYATVPAPFDGVVSGQFANVGDLSTPGRALVEIEIPSGRQFEASVSESLINSIELGDKHQIQFAELARPVAAELVEINPAGERSSRSWLAKWNLPENPRIRSGSFGRVSIPAGESVAIVIPLSTVMRLGQLEQVFVAHDGRAVLRLVKIGAQTGEQVEVLSGLMPGDRLITEHPADLRDGQPVTF